MCLQSVSPGLVSTELAEASLFESLPHLQSKDVSQGVLYALATPPHVNVSEIIMRAVNAGF